MMGRYSGRWVGRGRDWEAQWAIGGALVGWVGRGSDGEAQWAMGGARV